MTELTLSELRGFAKGFYLGKTASEHLIDVWTLDEVLRNSMRYEALRRLNSKQFSELCEKNIGDGIPFDDLVDKLIGENK